MTEDLNTFSAQVQKNYDSLSCFYDVLSGRAERRIVQKTLALFDPAPNSRFLDIGCGTGNALLQMKREFLPSLFIYGMDISMGMCLQAQRKLLRSMEKKAVPLCCGNALRAPFTDRYFDGILLSFTFELFPERLFTTLLSECRRMLKTNGKLLLVSMASGQNAGLIYRLYLWAHREYPQWIDCRPVDAARILADNGFRVTERKTYNLFGLPVDSLLAI